MVEKMLKGILMGVAGTIVVIAAVAFFYFRQQPAHAPVAPSQVAKTAARPGPTIVVNRKFGAWTLECMRPPKLPAWAQAFANKAGPPQPAGPRPPHCRVYAHLTDSKTPSTWADLIFGATGPNRVLNVHFKVAAGASMPGDMLELKLDDATIDVRMLLCGKDNCVAVPIRKQQEIATLKRTAGEQVLQSKRVSLVRPPSGGQAGWRLEIPTDGLPDAVEAMKKIQPMNIESLR
jgi:invasion protein IalB